MLLLIESEEKNGKCQIKKMQVKIHLSENKNEMIVVLYLRCKFYF